MVKKSKSSSKSKQEVVTVESEDVQVEVHDEEQTEHVEEVVELTYSQLRASIVELERERAKIDREIRAKYKVLDKTHNREVKMARKNRRNTNPNREKKEPSGFNKPGPIPIEFTHEPWNCDPNEEQPRTVLTKKVYEYIKNHNLQDEEDKRVIHPDKTLKKLFHLQPDDVLEFRTFQTHMAKLYNRENLPDVISEDDEEVEVVEMEEKSKKKSRKNKKSKKGKKSKGKAKHV